MAITWTQDDIDALKKAISGGVLTVTFDGPPKRSITYQSLSEMRALLSDMNRQITGAPTHRLVKWRKGFRDGNR